jgi:hypothetical protein
MHTKHRVIAVGTATLALGLGAAAQAQAVVDQFFLDSHEVQAPGDVYAGPASSTPLVVPLVPRVVTVEGAVSLWAKANWASPRFQVCGTPFSGATFPSPGVADGKVGVDAVGRFALVRKPAGACPELPDTSQGNFQFLTSTGYRTLKPLLSFGTLHTYLVTPVNGRIRVRFYDPVARDNYGRFRITVLPTL